MITRCTSASGTPLARAWAATISAYSASPATAACGDTSPAASSAATRKIFIRYPDVPEEPAPAAVRPSERGDDVTKRRRDRFLRRRAVLPTQSWRGVASGRQL